MASSPPPLPNFQPSSQEYPPPPPQQGPGQSQQGQYFPPPPPSAMSSPQVGGQSQPGTPYYPPPPGNPPPAEGQSNQQPTFYPPPPINAPLANASASHINQGGFSSPPATADATTAGYHNSAYRPNHDRSSLPPTPATAPLPSTQQPGSAGYPTQTPTVQAPTGIADTVGTFNGGSYRVDHRDSNSLLTIQLAHGCPFHAKPGAMVGMSPTVTLKGQLKFSFKKLVAGGDFASSLYTGPGEVLFAPPGLGDIVPVKIDGSCVWSLSKDGLLAYTDGVIKDHKAQGFGKAMLSGEGFFVYKITGNGILFITSLGAIIQKTLAKGEEYIVDNNHLVAWNCKYQLRQVTSGGMLSGFTAAEGVVCRFTGPGTIFIQTRNPAAFGAWVMGATTAAGK